MTTRVVRFATHVSNAYDSLDRRGAYFVAPGDSLVILGLRYTLVALFLGVWSPHGIVSLFSFIKQKLNVAR